MNARMPITWMLKNPYKLPIIITCRQDDTVLAEFPALPGCEAEGTTTDEAIFNLAKAIQARLEPLKDGAV